MILLKNVSSLFPPSLMIVSCVLGHRNCLDVPHILPP